jgi:outer membrane protein TolC
MPGSSVTHRLISRRRRRGLALIPLLLLPGAVTGQQPLRLADALARASGAGYANRMAAGEVEAGAGEALRPFRGILPALRVEAGYLRTTDPLNAFGFTLRQRIVTAAAFAPARLNDPSATGNLMTGLVLEQPLLNADTWLGRTAAARASAAIRARSRWTRSTTALQVVRAYFGAVLSRGQVATLEAASRAAAAHVRQAQALVRQGMATRSDALLAAVKAGEVEADLLRARGESAAARRGLALLMGDPADTGFVLPDSLPDGVAVQRINALVPGDSLGVGGRADVQAAGQASSAADADAQRAALLYLPRVNGFGRLDWNHARSLFTGEPSWTVGVMLSWSPFTGATELAERRAAAGRQASAHAQADLAQAQAALEVARARDEWEVGQARLELAERAVSQSIEAHRIVSRKYDGGLATVTELFDAAALETGTLLRDAAARYDLIAAVAELRHAAGLDLGPLQELAP